VIADDRRTGQTGRAFLIAAPGVVITVRERCADSWEAVAFSSGSGREWLGAGGGSLEDAVGVAERIIRALRENEQRRRRWGCHNLGQR
jgi:hypothetical protein